ncbi:hypothetical protein B7494_g5895 [Chlorociboria aeruginascens]|nr:hypothetical protein B7494_g5895 [Chlorociboria aeruginascens]
MIRRRRGTSRADRITGFDFTVSNPEYNMRPLLGEDASTGRSRSTNSTDNESSPLQRQQPQMTYFITDEKTMDASQASAKSASKPRESPKKNTFGVESLETTIGSLSQSPDEQDDRTQNARRNWKKNLASKVSVEDLKESRPPSPKTSNEISRNSSPSHQRRLSQATISRPFTPLSFASGGPTSILSSPDSRRNSDAGSLDDSNSQAIMSSGEDDGGIAPELMDSGSAPQLVMPSIKMPSRRPFTERGKNMGRLKVLIAGDSGVGKTSLIKAIVQTCEDIVHVDPFSPPTLSIPETKRHSKSKSRSGSAELQTTSQITEIYASTRSYPAWWSDFDESRILRRRKSMGDSILERNLCFVDTPGYGNKTSCLECINPVIDYIESHLHKFSSVDALTDSDLVNLLGGTGGSQVDVVFYLIYNRIKPVDIEYLRRLSSLTNVIPLISRSDNMSSEDILSVKQMISSELQMANIRPFSFGFFPEENFQSSRPSPPYAISTKNAKDHDNMDASLLMSPDYVQPLIESELLALVEQVFERDSVSWLRNSAAKKFIQLRNNDSNRSQSLYRPIASSPISSLSQVLTTPVGAATSYALARITDHTQREERLTQVRLSKWAHDLQRSIQNERARFEDLARSERAVWLTERLGECVQDGTIIPISEAQQPKFSSSGTLVKPGTYSRRNSHKSLNTNDPLGLLQLNSDMKRRGWIALQIVSSCGIIGGLAFWITKNWQGSGDWGEHWTGWRVADWF